jgi:predicted NUDIX family NTP pyrophosphohydrolase
MPSMSKLGAGLLMYRKGDEGPEVLLVHPGGPFFKNKDPGVWSLPKGVADNGEVGEQLLEVAKREFEEETGVKPVGTFDYLGCIRRRSDGKTVEVWAFAGDCDPARVTSNKILIEWPPRTGRKIEIPEVDRAAFFALDHARTKLCPYLVPVIDLFEGYLSSR